MNLKRSYDLFSDPPREFGLIPFWFWNDDLDEEELIGQLHTFHQAGVRMWAPYRIALGQNIPPGRHRLEIRVTNTMANAYEGIQAPSGLIGPVHLISRIRI